MNMYVLTSTRNSRGQDMRGPEWVRKSTAVFNDPSRQNATFQSDRGAQGLYWARPALTTNAAFAEQSDAVIPVLCGARYSKPTPSWIIPHDAHIHDRPRVL